MHNSSHPGAPAAAGCHLGCYDDRGCGSRSNQHSGLDSSSRGRASSSSPSLLVLWKSNSDEQTPGFHARRESTLAGRSVSFCATSSTTPHRRNRLHDRSVIAGHQAIRAGVPRRRPCWAWDAGREGTRPRGARRARCRPSLTLRASTTLHTTFARSPSASGSGDGRRRKRTPAGWAVTGSNGRPPACKARAGAAVCCRL